MVLFKVGKILLLKEIVNVISMNKLDVKLFILLVGECFEEVIDLECLVEVVEVVYLMFDELLEYYVKVVELLFECVKCLVEIGEDVIILMDFIMRLVCVYNLVILLSGCILLGGLDLVFLYKLKVFFGVVRNIEVGGSLIIFVIVLVDMGLCMDDMIYEEFKGIGNMELYLDRKLFECCIFFVIDIGRSLMCKEELLISKFELDILW